MTGEIWVLATGGLLMLCALAWMFLLTVVFSKRLSIFTRKLCQAMDQMISGSGRRSYPGLYRTMGNVCKTECV